MQKIIMQKMRMNSACIHQLVSPSSRSSDSSLYWVAKTQEILLVVLYYQHDQNDEDDPQNLSIYINLCFHILDISL